MQQLLTAHPLVGPRTATLNLIPCCTTQISFGRTSILRKHWYYMNLREV